MMENLCPECGRGELKIVTGWESDKAVECNKCGEYGYFVGNILCIKTAHFDDSRGLDSATVKRLLLTAKQTKD